MLNFGLIPVKQPGRPPHLPIVTASFLFARRCQGEGAMLNLTMGLHRSCDRVTRRELLRVGSLATLGFSLPGLLERPCGWARGGKDVSCILLWLQGGISHIDSFDPKPEHPRRSAASSPRLRPTCRASQVCDPLPKLAQHQDKYSIVRSLESPRTARTGSPTPI